MWVGKRHWRSGRCRRVVLGVTLVLAGCSTREEVIKRGVAQANQNLEAGDVPTAVSHLERLNQRYPDEESILEALGFAYARAAQHADAAACFARAADHGPEFGSLRLLAAESYLQAGALDRAAEQHRLYVKQFPAEYQSWQKLGAIEERQGNYLSATDAYLEAYRLHASGDLAFQLGSVFRELNNTPQAASWFETTIKHADSHVDQALLGLLGIELNARHFAAAARTMDQLDANYPGVLDASPLAAARDELAAWRTTQEAVEAARAEQERLARELAEARRQREAATTAPPAPPPAPPADTTAADAPAQPAPVAEPEAPPPTVASASPAATDTAPPAAAATTPGASATAPTPAPETGPAPEPPPPPPPAAPVAAVVPAATPPTPLAPAIRAARERQEAGDYDGAVDRLWDALARDDRSVDLWLELAACYRQKQSFSDAEACLLEAGRRAPQSIAVESAYLDLVRDSQPAEAYLARVAAARKKFPAEATFAFLLAQALESARADVVRVIRAYEDFLLLAAPDDSRRDAAAAYLARAGER